MAFITCAKMNCPMRIRSKQIIFFILFYASNAKKEKKIEEERIEEIKRGPAIKGAMRGEEGYYYARVSCPIDPNENAVELIDI